MKRGPKPRKAKTSESSKSEEDDFVFRWKGKGEKRNSMHFVSLLLVDVTFYNMLSRGKEIFKIGDAVELIASGNQPSLIGDYKVFIVL